ncbi:LamB/YcsF family protein [Chitinophaga horti]|uniref:LamB/YcsF family protein n=1 Tax=Chitinophaga horti TaxID=2920382 RepID=A0ABY6J9S2_9BACT|nr:5-oxoprolinase subunit PxpA [Chitinophaga horti]UYQ95317.1 LamB/YcsF family protein [Chitinophaga horti]
MHYIDLNCDMGEGIGNDAAIMPFISSSNIACGAYAGDEHTMRSTVDLAMQYDVAIGAHPGFNDKANFGRTNQQLEGNELYDLITSQVYALHHICREQGAKLHHVKPHGALYNMAATSREMSVIIAGAIKDVDPELKLYGLSGSLLISEATNAGLTAVSEVFADRSYLDDGTLSPRSMPGAVIKSEDLAVEQVIQMVTTGKVTAITGDIVPIIAETICLHGDGEHAAAFAQRINQSLRDHRLIIRYP